MPRLQNEILIDASPDAVWDVLGDLAATTAWLPGTVGARMEGDIRICTTADGFEIREEISDYLPEERTYRFRHLAVPMPITNSSGLFTVAPGDNGGARVVLESSFEAVDPAQEEQVRQMMEGALQQALQSLRRRIEEGRRWDAA